MRHLTGVDHLAVMVRDLDAAAAAWRRLGFNLSPRQTHSPNMGSANHTFVFGDSYVELIGLIAETEFNRPWRARLARREGAYIISLRTDDVQGAYRDLLAAGVQTSEPVPHSRPATQADGSLAEVAFDVTYLDPAATPAAHVSVCGHRTPERVFIPALAQHANSAHALAEIAVIATDPEGMAAAYERLFGPGSVRRGETDAVLVSTGDIPLRFIAPAKFRASYPVPGVEALPADAPAAITFRVRDRAATMAALRQGGVPFAEVQRTLVVGPAYASNTIVSFMEEP